MRECHLCNTEIEKKQKSKASFCFLVWKTRGLQCRSWFVKDWPSLPPANAQTPLWAQNSPLRLHLSHTLNTWHPQSNSMLLPSCLPWLLPEAWHKDGCRVVLSALGEFTFKEGQHGGGGRTPEKISIVHLQLGVGRLEGMEGALPLNFFFFFTKSKEDCCCCCSFV